MAQELVLTTEMIAVLSILAFTIFLFVSEVVRVDVAAVIVMVVLGLTSLYPGYAGLVPPQDLFLGFGSNAVISIIAVMIMGVGLDKTGAMALLAAKILKVAGTTESRIIAFISGTVAFISSFMQNIGAAALFMPVVARISRRTNIPLSRLLMPMGYCAILGGTMTMIGSSPLILLNDLIITSNNSLPASIEKMDTYSLFSVTPIGIVMVASGMLYFIVLGRFVLPANNTETAEPGKTAEYFEEIYQVKGDAFEVAVTIDSPFVGKQILDLEKMDNTVSVIALRNAHQVSVAPTRESEIWVGSEFVILGSQKDVEAYVEKFKLTLKNELESFSETLSPNLAGISEIVLPPSSSLIGKSIGGIRIRKRYGISVLAIYRGDETIRTDIRDVLFRAGDTLVVHSTWEDLYSISKDRDFVVVTDFPHEESRPHKFMHALAFFMIALALVLFTDLRLSIALMVGAIGMVVSGVLRIDEAYKAVGWQSVFLLASLIPLGVAVETTGTAAWIAQETLRILGDVPIWVLQAAVAILATIFTLVMSNVGATVLLVPLAVNIAIAADADPAIFALTVALATSNSFFIPTHQVNALIMGPAGYRVKDFMKAGSLMTVIFLVIMLVMLNIVF
ncbi:MAG: SLC13 family permease [Gammaproteobacteria bacterium]|nr:SLC13 family permease [Gammaproteobacteria bacterium]